MKRLYNSAALYLLLGLTSGVFYREFVRWSEFEGTTRLSVLHVHLLALGVLVFLIVLLLEKQFRLSESKWFNLFFWHYHAGLLLTVAMMVYIGVSQVQGSYVESGMIAGISGLGHILLTAGFVMLFVALNQRLKAESVEPVSANKS